MEEGTIAKIEEFLCFSRNSNQDLKILYNYTVLATEFTLDSLKTFYILNSETIITFKTQKITISEILYNCEQLLSKIADDLYSFILCNTFISRNYLNHEQIISKERLNDFCKKENWIKNQKIEYYIPGTERIINLINSGLLPTFISNVLPESLKLSKNTFKYLMNYQINIAELMNYTELDNDSINIISEKLLTDSVFKKQCSNFIEDQGILNSTMQIIASLLNIFRKSNFSDRSSLHPKYCGLHFENVYIPFSEFKAIGNSFNLEGFLGRLELYYIYLSHKKNLEDDLNDISIALATKNEPEQLIFSREGNLDISLTPLDDSFEPEHYHRSTSAQILDLVFKNELFIAFEPYSFRNLNELSTESYFGKIINFYARNIIENNIKIPMNDYLKKVSLILEFLKNSFLQQEEVFPKRLKTEIRLDNLIVACNNQKNLEYKDLGNIYKNEEEHSNRGGIICNEVACSLDTFATSMLFSSLNCEDIQDINVPCNKYQSNDNNMLEEIKDKTISKIPLKFQELSTEIDKNNTKIIEIPYIDFKTCKWMTEEETILLMEHYIKLHDINTISENFISLKSSTENINRYFVENLAELQNKLRKLIICCKLEIPFNINSYSDQEIRQALIESNFLFPLRNFIMTKKVLKKTIHKLFEDISHEKLEIIIREAFESNTSDDFIIVMLENMCKKYDFSHIFRDLIYILKMKKINLARFIQSYFIDLLKSMYLVESYIPLFEELYAEFLNYEDVLIKSNNDKILVLIAKCASAMDKETFYGNTKGKIN